MLRFHTQTAGSMLTAQQPENNVVRVTLQALAAVLGGTQSLHTNSRDEALSLPTEEAVQIALRTSRSSLTRVASPTRWIRWLAATSSNRGPMRLNGALLTTGQDRRHGWGAQAIEKGYIQREIQESAYRWQLAVDRQDRIVVGVNRFQVEEELALDTLRVDPVVASAKLPVSALCGSGGTTRPCQSPCQTWKPVPGTTTVWFHSSWMQWKSTPHLVRSVTSCVGSLANTTPLCRSRRRAAAGRTPNSPFYQECIHNVGNFGSPILVSGTGRSTTPVLLHQIVNSTSVRSSERLDSRSGRYSAR